MVLVSLAECGAYGSPKQALCMASFIYVSAGHVWESRCLMSIIVLGYEYFTQLFFFVEVKPCTESLVVHKYVLKLDNEDKILSGWLVIIAKLIYSYH